MNGEAPKAPPKGYRLVASDEAIEDNKDILVFYNHAPFWRKWSFNNLKLKEARLQGLNGQPWFAIPADVTEEFTLVIWSNVNEELVPDLIMLDNEAVQELGTTHTEIRGMEGVYINCSEDEEAATRLNAIVYDALGANRLNAWKLPDPLPQLMGPMTIVRCGFVN